MTSSLHEGGGTSLLDLSKMEIKNLWKLNTGDNTSTVINEYSSNLYKSKFDPLIAVEAKQALISGHHSPVKPILEEHHPVVSSLEEHLVEDDVDST